MNEDSLKFWIDAIRKEANRTSFFLKMSALEKIRTQPFFGQVKNKKTNKIKFRINHG